MHICMRIDEIGKGKRFVNVSIFAAVKRFIKAFAGCAYNTARRAQSKLKELLLYVTSSTTL